MFPCPLVSQRKWSLETLELMGNLGERRKNFREDDNKVANRNISWGWQWYCAFLGATWESGFILILVCNCVGLKSSLLSPNPAKNSSSYHHCDINWACTACSHCPISCTFYHLTLVITPWGSYITIPIFQMRTKYIAK